MDALIKFISQPWHWSVSGVAITFIMWLLLYTGKEFGVSSNLRTMCTIAGAGKHSDFFRIDWKAQRWNLLFVAGAVIGGALSITFLHSPDPVGISVDTQQYLTNLGVSYPTSLTQGNGYVPTELFSLSGAYGFRNLLLLVSGGFLVGFGTRWAGGCTSGHAISGLSNLQLPSLVAVIGFFLGGLIMAWGILPLLIGQDGLFAWL